jgi:hypothetical protein
MQLLQYFIYRSGNKIILIVVCMYINTLFISKEQIFIIKFDEISLEHLLDVIFEILLGSEIVRHQKVEDAPKFKNIILYRGSFFKQIAVASLTN